MTTLVVTELITDLEQDIRYNLDIRCNVVAFYPYLFLFNSPSGTFTFELIKDGDTLFSQNFDSQDIKDSLSTTNNYAHVFFPIIPTNPIQIEKGLYTIKLSSTGYTATSSSYLGWIQQHEDIQAELEYVPENDTENPFSIRIKKYE